MVCFFDTPPYSRLLSYKVTMHEKQAWLSVGEAVKLGIVNNLIINATCARSGIWI